MRTETTFRERDLYASMVPDLEGDDRVIYLLFGIVTRRKEPAPVVITMRKIQETDGSILWEKDPRVLIHRWHGDGWIGGHHQWTPPSHPNCRCTLEPEGPPTDIETEVRNRMARDVAREIDRQILGLDSSPYSIGRTASDIVARLTGKVFGEED